MSAQTISLIGAGNMGSALVKTFANAGHKMTVWNRTRSRAEELSDVANVAETLEDAISASDIIMVSLPDYDVCHDVIFTDALGPKFSGKTVVQYTSGSPGDARRSEAWAKAHSIPYLDGAILAYPQMIGTEIASVFYAGPETLFETLKPTVLAISPNAIFVKETIGSAAALDCAILEAYYGACLAFMHGAAICDAEGVSVETFFSYKAAFLALTEVTADQSLPQIAKTDYFGDQCALNVHHQAFRHIVRLSEESNLDTKFPSAIFNVMQASVDKGRGKEELSVLYDLLRNPQT